MVLEPKINKFKELRSLDVDGEVINDLGGEYNQPVVTRSSTCAFTFSQHRSVNMYIIPAPSPSPNIALSTCTSSKTRRLHHARALPAHEGANGIQDVQRLHKRR